MGAAPARAAESNEFRVARQPGLVYLQAIIMEEKKLIECCLELIASASEQLTQLLEPDAWQVSASYELYNPARAQAPLAADPFALGVASGRPAPR